MSENSDLLIPILQALPMGVAVLDDEREIDIANTTLGFMLNTNPEELKGSKLPYLDGLGESESREFESVNQNGEKRILMASIIPINGPEERNSILLATVDDITEKRKRKEDLENIAHQIICYRAVTKLFSQTETPLKQVLNTFVHLIPEGWQYPSITAARVTLGPTIVSSANYADTEWKQTEEFSYGEGLKGKLEVCYLENRSPEDEVPFSNEERTLIQTLANELERYLQRKHNEDIRRQQHRELEIYSKLLRHDLRNDLSVIIGNHELLQMVLKSQDDMVKQALSSSEAVFQRMMKLLRTFGRATDSEERKIAKMLRNIASRSERANPNITVDLRIDEEADNLRITESKLLPLVFENLFRNSAVHAGTNPKITVELSREGNNAKVIFRDDGPGIAEEIRDNLFEKGVSTRGGGLGLYLSRQVVEAVGGVIELLEPQEDSGATFEVLIPLSV
ncbi:MAG: hypothetical protein GF309_00510 [Candidatus Lokiarchaeota archaeon]|nr:hypothetical protein [Candidatus Lokiarchaeota archaeon]